VPNRVVAKSLIVKFMSSKQQLADNLTKPQTLLLLKLILTQKANLKHAVKAHEISKDKQQRSIQMEVLYAFEILCYSNAVYVDITRSADVNIIEAQTH
jgi:hypothetical protein